MVARIYSRPQHCLFLLVFGDEAFDIVGMWWEKGGGSGRLHRRGAGVTQDGFRGVMNTDSGSRGIKWYDGTRHKMVCSLYASLARGGVSRSDLRGGHRDHPLLRRRIEH